MSQDAVASLASEYLTLCAQYDDHANELKLLSDANGRPIVSSARGRKSSGTPDRNWRTSCGSKDTTPERSWRSSIGGVPNSGMTPERSWRTLGASKDTTPERNWRATVSKDTTPERNWRASTTKDGAADRLLPSSTATRRGLGQDGTPERGWRASVAKDVAPERTLSGRTISRIGLGVDGTPERSSRSSVSKDSTTDRTVTGATAIRRVVGNDATQERSLRAQFVGKDSAPEPSLRDGVGLKNSTKSLAPVLSARALKVKPFSVAAPLFSFGLQTQTPADESLIESLVRKGFLVNIPRRWPDDSEHVADDLAHVRGLFGAQIPNAQVLGVHRIENAGLGLVYGAVRGTLAAKRERLLWHGTSLDCVRNIALNGFNRAYCGRHGMKFGQGSYFSSAADYSLRFCERRIGVRRVMFLAKVIVGEWTKGSAEMVEPPHKDAEGLVRYDSTVDDEASPSIFCVFRDFQALPMYLVEFSSLGPAS